MSPTLSLRRPLLAWSTPALVMLHATVASDGEADREDVRLSLDGNGDAFARIIGRHQQRVAAHIWPFVRDPGRVEEIVHDTFVEAYLALASFRASAAFSTWLCAIATRVVYRRMRDRDRRGRRDAAFARTQGAPREPGPADARAEHLWAMVERLPARDRLVLTMMYAHGRSVAEIATLAGWSSALVKVQAFRARAKLRKILEEEKLP